MEANRPEEEPNAVQDMLLVPAHSQATDCKIPPLHPVRVDRMP
jgi:hypothetical protein